MYYGAGVHGANGPGKSYSPMTRSLQGSTKMTDAKYRDRVRWHCPACGLKHDKRQSCNRFEPITETGETYDVEQLSKVSANDENDPKTWEEY
jgi:hypothetical protein